MFNWWAPLLVIGDQMLFPQYDCMNLGGFSNVSLSTDGNRIAFDIS
jgi:anhydro-N-acetylmuramic acid kinase